MAIVERRIKNSAATRFEMDSSAEMLAGMRTAVLGDSVSDKDTLFAHGYIGTPAGLEPGPPSAPGGVWCTVGDMYRYLIAGKAFGWHVTPRSDSTRARIDKDGGSGAFASQLLYYPEDGVVIIWASNNLRQQWRQTLNRVLPDMVFGRPSALPPVVRPYPMDRLTSHMGKYRAGSDTLELRAGPGYLYAAPNKLNVPTDVIFLPQGQGRFAGFDPATGAVTRLDVRPVTVSVGLSNGRWVTVRRL